MGCQPTFWGMLPPAPCHTVVSFYLVYLLPLSQWVCGGAASQFNLISLVPSDVERPSRAGLHL